MPRSFFGILLTLLSGAGLLSAFSAPYPVSYSGGVGQEIHTRLTLLGPSVYTYDEWTHAGYTVHDSGHYELRNQRLLLTSIRTVHQRTLWKRVNGHRKLTDDAPKHHPLFRRTIARWTADTVLITKRRVLVNQEFDVFLVKDK